MKHSRALMGLIALWLLLTLTGCGTREGNTTPSSVWDQGIWDQSTWQ
jgi:hypothetical protein